jgi:hypothetical protein
MIATASPAAITAPTTSRRFKWSSASPEAVVRQPDVGEDLDARRAQLKQVDGLSQTCSQGKTQGSGLCESKNSDSRRFTCSGSRMSGR